MNTRATDRLESLIEPSAGAADALLTVHLGTCGIAAGAAKTLEAVRTSFASGSVRSLELKSSSCAGLCSCEPMVSVSRNGEQPLMYLNITEERVNDLFDCIRGIRTAKECNLQAITRDDPFYLRQQEIVFMNRGLIRSAES